MHYDPQVFCTALEHECSPLSRQQKSGIAKLLSFAENDPLLAEGSPCDEAQLAYLLATVQHECAGTWQPIVERGMRWYFAKYDPRTRLGEILGNTQPGDGFRFRGRGYAQITGRRNYGLFSARLGQGDLLLSEPDLALSPEIAWRILSIGMHEGLFTGKRLGQYITDERCSFVSARQTINGTDRASLIADYAARIDAVLRVARRP